MIVSKSIRINAAHFLPDYEGKCKNLHGHSWKIEVGVSGRVANDGMVLDFSNLKSWMKRNIEEPLDHHCLNDIIYNPTAENITKWIVERWMSQEDTEELFVGLGLAFVKVWETEDSCAEWRSPDALLS